MSEVVYTKKCFECGQFSAVWSMYCYAGEWFCSTLCRDDYAEFLTKTFHPIQEKREEGK